MNLNSLGGNSKIPSRLIYKNEFAGHDDLAALKTHTRISRIRTQAWAAERDQETTTPWLHCPFSGDEVKQLNAYILNNPFPLEMVISTIWESLWMATEIPGWTPDNPFASPIEIADALLVCVQSILPALAKVGAQLDLFCEFEPTYSPHQNPVMESYYPRALAACRAAGVRYTVSAIVDVNGSFSRPTAAYEWLMNNGGLPDFAEVHPNGCNDFSNFQIESRLFADHFKLPWSVGECDVPGDEALRALVNSGAEEVLLWV